MLRWSLIFALIMLISAPLLVAQEEPYDEYGDSPMVELDCGTFPAVRVMVDGSETEGRGFIRGGRTFLPARETLERLGGSVVWVSSERAFYARFPERQRTIRVAPGSRTVRIYRYNADARYGAGQQTGTVQLNVSPFTCEGRIFAPVRAATEAAGGSAHYDRRTRTVHVTSPRDQGR